MIIVALIYSITSSLGKMAVVHSSPVFFGVIYVTVLFILCYLDFHLLLTYNLTMILTFIKTFFSLAAIVYFGAPIIYTLFAFFSHF